MTPELDVAVVGAGIAGLTAAHELRRAGLSVRVYERLPDVGGRMRSLRHQGWTIAVLGPGGVGGLLAALLSRAGHRVICL
ncbi:FAD-dependent oxidoreductase, partial [Streptomyces sp. SID6137]|uniref:FAD-dependent oxidoreductase n=1 Tax=Streptomyces sp. SID6137 TaxID=2690319 RepID=UPI001928B714